MNKELIKKAKLCKTKEELLKLAKENDFELSPEEAELYLQDFKEGEVADAELDNVAGGQDGCSEPARFYKTIYWDRKEDVEFIFEIGQVVEAFPALFAHHTATVKVVNRQVTMMVNLGYCDIYWLEKEPGSRTPWVNNWYNRDTVQLP